MEYQTVIGLEVHLELSTKSKVFCGCAAEFGRPPNSQVCPVCLGLPGVLPVLNKEALYSAIKVALALNCRIAEYIKFDRKNYFYPDLPKNFQISQYDKPLSFNGFLDIELGDAVKRAGITRVHLEEDTGKLIHPEEGKVSLVDFNRSGIPLLEIVSEPDLGSPEEAYIYLLSLKSILEYLDVSLCDMEKGSLRCDANISIRADDTAELGVKTEIKNMNSFKAVRSALEFEEKRQRDILRKGEKILQETRLWNDAKGVTLLMRSKEEAHDYRYFPEPDLPPFIISKGEIEKIRGTLPELPKERCRRFITDYAIPEYDSHVLTRDKNLADYFEECVRLYPKAKIVSNWMMGELQGVLNERGLNIKELPLKPVNLAEMLKMIDEGVISGKIAKELLPEMIDTGGRPRELVKKKGLVQISDEGALAGIIDKVISQNPNTISDFEKGKKQAFTFLIGQVMKETKGKANPGKVNEIMQQKLTELKLRD